jgi:hypothetical protein
MWPAWTGAAPRDSATIKVKRDKQGVTWSLMVNGKEVDYGASESEAAARSDAQQAAIMKGIQLDGRKPFDAAKVMDALRGRLAGKAA